VIAEAFANGAIYSPSCQGCIDLNGNVQLLSTHEQVLQGHVYLGCTFPCNSDYRKQIQDYTMRVGKSLASKGVADHFGVDFLAVPKEVNKKNCIKCGDEETVDGDYDLVALEINLRKGGTTHPLMALKLSVPGEYDSVNGHFTSTSGKAKHYVASDNLSCQKYKGLLPQDIIELFQKHENVNFNSRTETGVIFHLMGALSQFGKLGITCIADSKEEAMQLYNKAVDILGQECLRTVKV